MVAAGYLSGGEQQMLLIGRAIMAEPKLMLIDEPSLRLEGQAQELRDNEDVREFYLGLDREGVRKSFRAVKHYKRRKRWLG